jgi:signal transduction histidine kinase
LWFATTGGVSRLDPRLKEPISSSRIVMTSITAGGRTIPLSDVGETDVKGFTLKPGANQLRLEFTGINYSTGHALRYRYKLEGADSEWTGPTFDHSVQYASLGPGDYRFVVETVAGDGSPNDNGAVVAFSVMPPIWRRWWFIAGGSAMVAFLLLAAHRARVARVVAVERVRTRIATDLHDELGSSLSRVAVLTEVIKGDVSDAGPDITRRLEDIATTARELLASTNDLVWSVHPQRDDLQSLVTRVRRFAADLFEASGIAWEVHAPGGLEAVILSPERRWHILMILKEGIHNIIRHADAHRVVLTIERGHRRLTFDLKDDGRGFSPAIANTGPGHGLRNMATRADGIAGQLTIASGECQGTLLRLSIPL